MPVTAIRALSAAIRRFITDIGTVIITIGVFIDAVRILMIAAAGVYVIADRGLITTVGAYIGANRGLITAIGVCSAAVGVLITIG